TRSHGRCEPIWAIVRTAEKSKCASSLPVPEPEGDRMTTVDERGPGHGRQLRISLLCRGAIGVAVALAGLTAAIGPASAVASTDGTSNTIQLAVTSAVLDQAHHRVAVTAPAAGDLAGRHLATVEVVSPRLTYTLTNTMVSGFVGASSESVSISF